MQQDIIDHKHLARNEIAMAHEENMRLLHNLAMNSRTPIYEYEHLFDSGIRAIELSKIKATALLENHYSKSNKKLIHARQEAAEEVNEVHKEIFNDLFEEFKYALSKVKLAFRYAVNNPQLLR